MADFFEWQQLAAQLRLRQLWDGVPAKSVRMILNNGLFERAYVNEHHWNMRAIIVNTDEIRKSCRFLLISDEGFDKETHTRMVETMSNLLGDEVLSTLCNENKRHVKAGVNTQNYDTTGLGQGDGLRNFLVYLISNDIRISRIIIRQL